MARHVLKGPREMFTLRRVFAFWAMVAFVLGLAGEVRAQSVTLPATGVSRRARSGNLINSQINFDDCNINEPIKFTVALTAPNSAWSLQVWAGANCDVPANRQMPTLQNCWQIGEGLAVSSINPPPLLVPVRDILLYRTQITGASSVAGTAGTAGTAGADATAGTSGADATAGTSGADATAGTSGADAVSGGGAGGTSGTAGTSGTSGSGGSSTLTADQAACTPKDSNTAAQNISVYFMMVDSASAIQGSFAVWNATYKLLAPAPPDKVSANIGENLLPISFSYSGTTSDTSINGYNFYCDPPPGTVAAEEAGVLPMDGGLAVTSCSGMPSVKLIAGAHASSLSKFQCGNAGKNATSGNATGLVNGVAYNVAVATTDSYNNIGVLSVSTCQVPQPVTGFYEAYTNAGGKGGGGFCSFARHREKLTLFALLGCAACLFLRRRRAA